jgi:hypothetical protein
METVDNRIPINGLVHRTAERGGADGFGEFRKTHGGRILMNVVDDVFVELTVQNFSKFVNVPTAVVLVDCEDRVDNLADDGGSRTLSSSAFVVADNRGRDLKALGKKSLRNVETLPPFLESLTR